MTKTDSIAHLIMVNGLSNSPTLSRFVKQNSSKLKLKNSDEKSLSENS